MLVGLGIWLFVLGWVARDEDGGRERQWVNERAGRDKEVLAWYGMEE